MSVSLGVEVQGYFLRVVDVAACVARTQHELGAVNLGAELDAIFSSVDLGTAFSGANLPDMAGPNVHVSARVLLCLQ